MKPGDKIFVVVKRKLQEARIEHVSDSYFHAETAGPGQTTRFCMMSQEGYTWCKDEDVAVAALRVVWAL